jgi:hypothetical protein
VSSGIVATTLSRWRRNAQSPETRNSSIASDPSKRGAAAPACARGRGEVGLAHRRAARRQEDHVVAHQREHGLDVAGPRRFHPGGHELPYRAFVVVHRRSSRLRSGAQATPAGHGRPSAAAAARAIVDWVNIL